MWNFLEVMEMLPDLNFVNYAVMAVLAYGVSMLVSMVIKGGNLE